jgi:hypothetical protein
VISLELILWWSPSTTDPRGVLVLSDEMLWYVEMP